MGGMSTIPGWESRTGADRVLLAALLLSLVLHAGSLYAADRWGSCICNIGRVVCPKLCPDPAPRIVLKLSKIEEPPPPPPQPERTPRAAPKPTVFVKGPGADRPPAAPKAGQVVLPDQALEQTPRPQAEITLDRPTIPEEIVVKESEAAGPIIATADIFGRTQELTPGPAGVFGLGGAGTATGIGPFGTEEEAGGQSAAEHLPAPAQQPKLEPPKPEGPTRPPRVLNWTDPPYPEQARQQGIEGTVVLKLTVTSHGRPAGISVHRSSGHAALDAAAVSHVKQAKFLPALERGAPVKRIITFRVRFRLVNA